MAETQQGEQGVGLRNEKGGHDSVSNKSAGLRQRAACATALLNNVSAGEGGRCLTRPLTATAAEQVEFKERFTEKC